MKIAVIGGGSTYTPELVDGLIQQASALNLKDVVLMDIHAERLEVVGAFAKRMCDHAKAPFKLRTTTNRAEAIANADYVVTQIRVGMMQARYEDEILGLRHDLIGQETTGVGGFAKALRTIPAMREIVGDIKKLAPEAWLVNFTNPSGLVTEALTQMGHKKVVGLCNIPIGMKMDIAAYLGCYPSEVDLDYVGLNHLSWVRDVKVNGDSVMKKLMDDLMAGKGPLEVPEYDYGPAFWRALGAIPGPYLRYYYIPNIMLEQLKGKEKTRAQEVMEVEKQLLAMYADESVVEKPQELEQRGGAFYSKIAVELIQSLERGEGDVHIVNLPNRGAVPGIGDDQTVEVAAKIYSDHIEPLPVSPVHPNILGLMQVVKAYESLAVRAGMAHSYNAALMALNLHPLCGPVKAKAVLDDIIRTNGLTLGEPQEHA